MLKKSQNFNIQQKYVKTFNIRTTDGKIQLARSWHTVPQIPCTIHTRLCVGSVRQGTCIIRTKNQAQTTRTKNIVLIQGGGIETRTLKFSTTTPRVGRFDTPVQAQRQIGTNHTHIQEKGLTPLSLITFHKRFFPHFTLIYERNRLFNWHNRIAFWTHQRF